MERVKAGEVFSLTDLRKMDWLVEGVVVIVVLLLLVVPARAQQSSNMPQIGCLILGSPVEFAPKINALKLGLLELGYVEGKNITLVFRWAERPERLPELAAELVRLKVDVLIANSSTEVEVAKKATRSIPIVFATHADPVGVGHVASLAHPGGNVTGLSVLMTDLVPKQLEIMKQTLPHMKKVGVLAVSSAPSTRTGLAAAEAAARKLGVQALRVLVGARQDLDAAFATMVREHVDGFVVLGSPILRANREMVAGLQVKHRLPGMFGPRENVEVGGLISYFSDLEDMTRRAATYIDKILKGARPADLPVEQASKYALVINLKTAKAIGLTIPPAVLARADQVIE